MRGGSPGWAPEEGRSGAARARQDWKRRQIWGGQTSAESELRGVPGDSRPAPFPHLLNLLCGSSEVISCKL